MTNITGEALSRNSMNQNQIMFQNVKRLSPAESNTASTSLSDSGSPSPLKTDQINLGKMESGNSFNFSKILLSSVEISIFSDAVVGRSLKS
jgi:hypothetical protein